MKKILIIFIMLFVILSTVAAENGHEEIDYGSSEDVNRLEPQDLASAIEQGKITDMSVVDDNKLADALSNNPLISTKLEDGELARAVNQDLSLLDNPSVMRDFDARAQSNTYILNDNPNIKKKWFADKGIADDGAELETYDGSIVKTKGSQATTFNVYNHPGARVTKDGKLILADGAEIASATITQNEDGSIDVQGGQTDLSNSQNTNVNVQKGDVKIGEEYYRSTTDTDPIRVSIKEGIPTISTADSRELTIDESITGKIYSKSLGKSSRARIVPNDIIAQKLGITEADIPTNVEVYVDEEWKRWSDLTREVSGFTWVGQEQKYVTETSGPYEITEGTKIRYVPNALLSDDSGNVKAEFYGQITVHDENHLSFGEETKLTEYADNQKTTAYSVKKPTEYYTEPNHCGASSNCIENNQGKIRVKASEQNNVKISDLDASISSLQVDKIDRSDTETKVVFSDTKNNVQATFSNEPVRTEGFYNGLSADLTSEFEDEEGNTIKQVYNSHGEIVSVRVPPSKGSYSTREITPKGSNVVSNYDEEGRLVSKKYYVYSSGELEEEVFFDPVTGKKIEVRRNGQITDKYEYHPTGEIKTHVYNFRGETIENSWDQEGNSQTIVRDSEGAVLRTETPTRLTSVEWGVKEGLKYKRETNEDGTYTDSFYEIDEEGKAVGLPVKEEVYHRLPGTNQMAKLATREITYDDELNMIDQSIKGPTGDSLSQPSYLLLVAPKGQIDEKTTTKFPDGTIREEVAYKTYQREPGFFEGNIAPTNGKAFYSIRNDGIGRTVTTTYPDFNALKKGEGNWKTMTEFIESKGGELNPSNKYTVVRNTHYPGHHQSFHVLDDKNNEIWSYDQSSLLDNFLK